MPRSAFCWCWGVGWDSTAGLIKHVWAGQPIDLITFADHGAEKRFPDRENGEEVGTYEFFEMFSDWLVGEGYPRPFRCRYEPKPVTHERYLTTTQDVIRELGLEGVISPERIEGLSGIYGNAIANSTMPGLAFNVKSCSIKWKLEAQEPI